MHDVDRDVGDLGHGNGAVRGFSLRACRPGERVILRRGVPLGQRLPDEHVDDTAIFGVHADRAAVLARALQRAEDRGVIQHEDAGVGHEQLERCHPLPHQRVHLVLDLIGQLRDDHVKAVIDGRAPFGLAHPRLPRVVQRLPLVLNGEIDHRRGAAERRRNRARFEIVGGGRAAERHVEMRVAVDATGKHELARRIDHAVGRDVERDADGRDALVLDEHVADVLVRGGHDCSAFDQDPHGSISAIAVYVSGRRSR